LDDAAGPDPVDVPAGQQRGRGTGRPLPQIVLKRRTLAVGSARSTRTSASPWLRARRGRRGRGGRSRPRARSRAVHHRLRPRWPPARRTANRPRPGVCLSVTQTVVNGHLPLQRGPRSLLAQFREGRPLGQGGARGRWTDERLSSRSSSRTGCRSRGFDPKAGTHPPASTWPAWSTLETAAAGPAARRRRTNVLVFEFDSQALIQDLRAVWRSSTLANPDAFAMGVRRPLSAGRRPARRPRPARPAPRDGTDGTERVHRAGRKSVETVRPRRPHGLVWSPSPAGADRAGCGVVCPLTDGGQARARRDGRFPGDCRSAPIHLPSPCNRFPVLAHWSFHRQPGGRGRSSSTCRTSDGRPARHPPRRHRPAPAGAGHKPPDPPPDPPAPAPELAEGPGTSGWTTLTRARADQVPRLVQGDRPRPHPTVREAGAHERSAEGPPWPVRPTPRTQLRSSYPTGRRGRLVRRRRTRSAGLLALSQVRGWSPAFDCAGGQDQFGAQRAAPASRRWRRTPVGFPRRQRCSSTATPGPGRARRPAHRARGRRTRRERRGFASSRPLVGPRVGPLDFPPAATLDQVIAAGLGLNPRGACNGTTETARHRRCAREHGPSRWARSPRNPALGGPAFTGPPGRPGTGRWVALVAQRRAASVPGKAAADAPSTTLLGSLRGRAVTWQSWKAYLDASFVLEGDG